MRSEREIESYFTLCIPLALQQADKNGVTNGPSFISIIFIILLILYLICNVNFLEVCLGIHHIIRIGDVVSCWVEKGRFHALNEDNRKEHERQQGRADGRSGEY